MDWISQQWPLFDDLVRAQLKDVPMLSPCYSHFIPMLFPCYPHVISMLFPCYLHVISTIPGASPAFFQPFYHQKPRKALDISVDPALKETVVLKLNGGLGTSMGLDKVRPG